MTTPGADSCRMRGEITGIAEREGRLLLRIAINGGTIEIAAPPGEHFHAGETVLLDGEMHIASAAHEREPAHHPPDGDVDFLS